MDEFSTFLGVDYQNHEETETEGDGGLGWVSVVPDAIAEADLVVNGERLVFTGYGGHDKVSLP